MRNDLFHKTRAIGRMDREILMKNRTIYRLRLEKNLIEAEINVAVHQYNLLNRTRISLVELSRFLTTKLNAGKLFVQYVFPHIKMNNDI